MAHKKTPTQPPVIVIEPKEKFGKAWPCAFSLKPGVEMMDACIDGERSAIAIRDAWQFRHPVTLLSRAQYEAMVDRGTVTLHG